MKPPKAKSKRIAIMFFAVGAWGIGIGSMFGNPFMLYLSVLNLVLGGVFTVFYSRAKK